MRRLAALLFASLLATAAQAVTLDELLARNLVAHGGLARMQALQTLRVSGRYVGGGDEIPFTDLHKRPAAVRSEYTYQGLTAVDAYDGHEAWRISPFQGRKEPDRIPAEESHGLMEDADIDGPLVDTAAKGIELRYLGVEDVDGTPAHKIKVTRPYGDIQFVYLDPDHFLEIRIITQRFVRGVLREFEVDFGDYELVDGVYLAFAIAAGRRGSTDKQQVVIDKVETNVAIDDAVFRFPAAAAAKN